MSFLFISQGQELIISNQLFLSSHFALIFTKKLCHVREKFKNYDRSERETGDSGSYQ